MVYQQVGRPLTKDLLEKALDELTEEEQGIVQEQIKQISTGLDVIKSKEADRVARATNSKIKKRPTGFGEASGLELIARIGIFVNEMNEKDPEGVRAFMKSRRSL